MKAHIARNQNAGVPMVLEWNLAGGERGILDGMSAAFGMKCRVVQPEEAGMTVAQLLGEDAPGGKTLRLDPAACPPAIVLANFRDKDLDTLLDLLRQANAQIPLKAVVTPTNRNWVFGDLLGHLLEERAAFVKRQG